MEAEEINMTPVDRTDWASGPWDDEGDRVEWRDEATGLPCLLHRNTFGAWCGYVGMPPGHPWHGLPYDDVDASAHSAAHGGLTYAEKCQPEAGICHVPEPGEPEDVWWLGFDCAHANDYVPGMAAMLDRLPRYEPELLFDGFECYKPQGYVMEACRSLAAVAADAAR